jgi:hypothetical protein
VLWRRPTADASAHGRVLVARCRQWRNGVTGTFFLGRLPPLLDYVRRMRAAYTGVGSERRATA